MAGQRQGADGELCSDVRAGPTARLTRDWIPVRLMDVCTSCNAWRMFSFLLSTFENNSSNRFDGTILRHKNKLIFLGHLIYIPMLAMHFSRRLWLITFKLLSWKRQNGYLLDNDFNGKTVWLATLRCRRIQAGRWSSNCRWCHWGWVVKVNMWQFDQSVSCFS